MKHTLIMDIKSKHLNAFIVFLGFWFVSLQLNGQGTEPKVIPPSPNASAFAKYGNIPVSTYTGLPNISIPIYEIKVRDITVPISLSYHASGIRVGDESSRVGLGWVLNAGGMISRNILNRDDLQELPDAFLSSMSSAPAIPQGPNFPAASYVQAPVLYRNPSYVDRGPLIYKHYSTQGQSGVPIEIDLTPFLQMTGNNPLFKPNDFEPDQFTYNFLNYSGKFVMNRLGEVILEKQEKIRIRLTTPSTPTWEITTPDGFVYKFNDFEYISENGIPDQRTAWYITEIISPQGEHVNFYYTSEALQYIIPVGSFYERWAPNVLSCANLPCRQQPNYRHPIVGKNYSNIALDRIEWSNGKIKFNVASDRLDIEGDKRITSVQIFKKDAVDPYEEVVFSQDYFTSSSAGPMSENEFPTNNPEKALKRMKLTGLKRRSLPLAANQYQQYSFEYYEDQPFPPKNSFARDHWGYYNGKNGNKSLIPKYTNVITANTSLTDIIGVMGAERDPSSAHASLLSLKSITYPTKGKSTFYYSSNDYEYTPPAAGEEPETFTETESFIYNTNNKGVVQSTLFDLTDEYVNAEGDVVPTLVSAAFRTNMSFSCDQMLGTPNIYFEIVNQAGATWGRVSPNGVRCTPPEELGCITCQTGSMVFTYKGSLVLPPGIYYWKAFMESTEAQIVDISAQYTWTVDANKRADSSTEPDGSLKKYKTGGGIRISKIEDYDPANNQKANVKRYEYHYKTDVDQNGIMESHSFGKRMVKPKYSYYDVSIEAFNVGGNYNEICLSCITLVRDSGHPLANYDGSPFAYDKVIEYLGENGENGYTEYEYENIEDEVMEYLHPYPTDPIPYITIDKLPIQPPTYASIKNPGNGNLIKQTHFSASGSKVMMTENIYQLKYNNVMYGLSSREMAVDASINLFARSFVMMMLYQTVNSNFPYLSETAITQYNPTGSESLKVTTQYYYDNQLHLQLTKQINFESKGNKTITTYKYPADYADVEGNTALVSMKGEKFMHASPVEITVLNEDAVGTQKLKHRELTIYDTFNARIFPKEKVAFQNTDLLTLGSIPPYVPASGYDQQLYRKHFTLDYNTSGNLKKIQKNFDIPVGYLWGYSETLPIAEIKNGTAEESFFTSFEEDGTTFTDVSGNLARTGVKISLGSSYTFPSTYLPVESSTLMSYWYWQNNKWNFSGVIPFQRIITSTGDKIDEVRAYPKSAQMVTYTYDLAKGITTITDSNNSTTYYEYDEFSRLKLIRDDKKNILNTYQYHYKN
jgi:YD repeat-containing protein